MKYLSVCSGIEAASVAWHTLGWQPVAFSEIEKFPSQVLAHHYPDVPNLGDMTKFKEWPDESIDILVGGTPCQSFSVAGLRKGLDDPRGNLALTYLGIADRYKPRWIVWENVPGVLSSNGGRDFGSFLGALAKLGYGFAYRVLDAQYFGVAQRRRRVFVVGCLGDWRRAAAVLFERDSLSGNPAPRRETRKVAPTIPSRSTAGGGLGTDFDCDGGLIAARMVAFGEYADDGTASAMKARDWKDATDLVAQPVAFTRCDYGGDAVVDGTPTMRCGSNYSAHLAVAQPVAYRVHGEHSTAMTGNGSAQVASPVDVTRSLDTCGGYATNQGGNIVAQPMAFQAMQVRRLTPTECERLQGFPDGYTNIKENCPDGPRYKALGNSMAVPVMRWIGERIQTVNEISDINKSKRAA